MSTAVSDQPGPTPAAGGRADARPRTLWEEGRLPGPLVVVAAVVALGAVVGLDLSLGAGLGWILDVGFVLVCLTAALSVRPGEFFGIGVLPPLLLLGTMLVVGVLAPGAIGSTTDSRAQSVVAGLALHAGALFGGYAGTLGILAIRLRALTIRRDREARRGSPYAVREPHLTDQPARPHGRNAPDWSELQQEPLEH